MRSAAKEMLRELLVRRQLDQVADRAADTKRILGTLVSLTFDPDPQIGWRAVEAMGVAAARIAERDPEYVRNHLRRLLWLISEESGGQCWRAPEAMAEIVRQRPDLFGDYAPIVVCLLREMAEEDLERFRPGVLWAIGRLGSLADDDITEVLDAITSALGQADPQARGMAVWCLNRVGRADLLAERVRLLDDEGHVEVYEGGCLERTTVGALARRASGS